MPPALIERHGIDVESIAPVLAAFDAGDVERALELTPDDVVDRLTIAGTPEEWVERITRDVVPTGIDHLLLSFADEFTVRAWSGRSVGDVPTLREQLTLVHDEVLPALG